MQINDIETFGWNKAIIGMRKSWDSENKSDSGYIHHDDKLIGTKDKKLILHLCKSGTSHRKFLRCVHIQANIIAPFYWWTEMDTYKIGTTRLSSSTMHTITKEHLTAFDFEMDFPSDKDIDIIQYINLLIREYQRTKEIEIFRHIKQILPSSYLYDCILDFNYENFVNMYKNRINHKLKEWQYFLTTIIDKTPMMKEIIDATTRRTQ